MDRSTRICKICGKEYPYCKTVLKNGEVFRWQDVACCEEHGSEYFAQIIAARAAAEPIVAKEPEPVVDDEEIDIYEECDEEEEDDFEDEEDEEEDVITE